MKRKKTFYWIIIAMLLCATALSFLDRQVLSISIIRIKEELGITDVEYGFINAGFLISYAVMFSLGGILIDRYGSRIGLGISVAFWSAATALHGLAQNTFHFGFFRFLLGIGEGGCFPGAVKAVMEWVPKNKRALANGLAIGGSALGAVIALPLSAYFLGFAGWRALFFAAGFIGMAWFAGWWVLTRKKKQEGLEMHATTDMQEEPEMPEASKTDKPPFSWRSLLQAMKAKEARVFIVMRFLLDPIFYFYMFWIPKYLSDARGMSIDTIGYITWIPFLALGVANIAGGWFSDITLKRSGSVNLARKLLMGIGAALTIPVAFITGMHAITLIVVVMSLAFFAHGLWITNYITSISDVFGSSFTSTIVGLSGTAGAISSLVINPLTGYIVSSFSYTPLWIYAGVMYPCAFLILIVFLPKIQPRKG